VSPPPASAQAGGLTVLAVKSALEGAIEEFRKAMNEATHDLQSLGNSLQSNAQNVVLDIDRTLTSKINLTFDRLDATELRLVEDAQALTAQVNAAARQVIAKAGEEARNTIVEADITAYNASYSLPCRDSKPRALASFPARLISARPPLLVTIKGNFLRQGTLSASINAVPAVILERLDRQVSVQIPPAVLSKAVGEDVVLTVKLAGFEEVERSLWLWGLLGCHETRTTVADAQAPLGLTILEPPVTYRVSGTTRITYTNYRDVVEPAQPFENTGSDKCDDSYRVDQQWCISGPGTLSQTAVSVTSANCHSGYEGYVPSGDRCALVRGKVGGCGAVRAPVGNTWISCKGRGWLKYNIQLTRHEPFADETASRAVDLTGGMGQKSFSIPLEAPPGLAAASPWYALNVNQHQGRKVLQTFAISHANPNVGPVTSRVNNGLLAVEIAE
jgi:hypothetical protein